MITPLKGLVLVGGQSSRMKEDKGLINLHGKPQRLYTYDLLRSAGVEQIYFSCRPDQASELSDYPLIIDKPGTKGPGKVILNTFEKVPESAWLIVACDLPLLSVQTVRELIEKRNPEKVATAFHLPDKDFPEPLITIWEPKANQKLKTFFEEGNRRLIDFLNGEEVEIILPTNPESLFNMNDQEARKGIEKRL